MQSRQLIATALILLLTAAVSSAVAGDGDGGYAGSFLQMPIGARPAAMGGAYLAVSNDGAGVLYNPAGLTSLQRPMLATSYRLMKLDRKLGYATAMLPARGNSVIGLHWLYGGSGSVERRNYDGDALGDQISMNSHAFSIIFAKRFESAFSAGVKMNYLHSQFAEMSAYSVGIDFGVMFYLDHLFGREKVGLLPIDDAQVGITLNNLDATYNWNNEAYVHKHISGSGVGTEQADEIPMEFGLGLSGRLMQRKLLLATDLIKNAKQGAELHAGAEYFVKPEFAFRGGFSDGRLTAGTGYVFRIGSQTLAIDYAFSTDKADEGSEHIFSFDLLF
ncbi:MAG: PorV/PorQ family protein [bacterium]